MPNDITGQKFSRLTAVKPIYKKGSGTTIWRFKCDCGNGKEINKFNVIRGSTKSCGCLYTESANKNRVDISNQKFGNMTALYRIDKKNDNKSFLWQCLCDCGKYFTASVSEIKRNNHKSCGCKFYYEREGHASWRGGKYTTNEGYIYIKDRKHPNASKQGYVLEHRLVMEKILKRHLLPNENVHHKNGIRADNRPENLELWVKMQPAGQRAEDLISYALEILKQYAPEKLAAQ